MEIFIMPLLIIILSTEGGKDLLLNLTQIVNKVAKEFQFNSTNC